MDLTLIIIEECKHKLTLVGVPKKADSRETRYPCIKIDPVEVVALTPIRVFICLMRIFVALCKAVSSQLDSLLFRKQVESWVCLHFIIESAKSHESWVRIIIHEERHMLVDDRLR